MTTAAHGASLARTAAARTHALAAARAGPPPPRLPAAAFADAPSSADAGAAALAARLSLAPGGYSALLAAARPPPRKRRPGAVAAAPGALMASPAKPQQHGDLAGDAGRKRKAGDAAAAARWGDGAAPRPPLAPANPPAGPRGFRTARAAMAGGEDDGFGGEVDASAYSSGPMFPNGAGAFTAGRKAAVAGGGRQGFVPPMVARALAGPHGGGGGGAGGARARGGAQPAAAAPTSNNDSPVLSDRTLILLGGVDGALPPPLDRLDPRTVETICNEVLDASPAVTWDDIAGQAAAKAAVQELAVWPMLNPALFTGPRAPPRGILLFGPPGTGKTLLGRAIASNVEASFFSISASSLTSKWIGEGEKLVRALFAVAAALAPSVVFVDEIDSLLTARGQDGEHEASRRLKTELLVQMEGCASATDRGGNPARVLVVGATNRPEELDEAARRRLPKQLYVPLPCADARAAMLARALRPGCGVSVSLSDADTARIVDRTAGYSGSDMRALIAEACQGPVRDALAAPGAALAGLAPGDLRPVALRDFAAAARAQRPSVEEGEVARYEAYNARHGAKARAGAGGGGTPGGEMDVDDW